MTMRSESDITGAGEVRLPDEARPRPILTPLGWGHCGYHILNRRRATLGLCLLLAVPFIADLVRGQLDRRPYPDLQLWRTVAADYLNDPAQSLYHKHSEYVYPPFFLTLIYPLCLLPPRAATAVFAIVRWLALFLNLRIACRLASPRGEDPPPVVVLAGLLLTWRFIWNDLGHGNINLLLLLSVLGGCWLVARNRPLLAGLVVALAACVKLTPALLLLYFVYKGWWRALIGAAAGVAVCLLIWPAIFLGWSANLHGLAGWYEHVVAGYFRHGDIWSIHINQSLVAILNRLLGSSVAIDPDVRVALVVLPRGALDAIRVLLTAAILAALAWICRGRLNPHTQPVAFAAEIAMVQIAMLLLSGFTWKAHFVAMLLPYTLLMAVLADRRCLASGRGWLAGLVVGSFVLCTLTGDLLGPVGANYAEAFGLVALGAVLAGVGVAVVRVRLRRCGPQ